MTVDIDREFVPTLLEWLREAVARGGQIAVEPAADQAAWRVIAHNGQGGQEAAGTILGTSASQMDAELLAAGLWALLATRP